MPKEGGLKKLQKEVEKVYLINDPYVVKFLVASIITHKIKGDPVWPVIVAPSGGAKSEFINMISKCKGVHALSTLTSHTFISGQKKSGQETSLLLKMQNGIITFKDLTSLFSENKEERGIIMAQLREIYDGKYSKTFGTGEELEWIGKITVIAGATYAIHRLKQSYTALGERFLFYNLIQPERSEAADKTIDNQEEGLMAEHRDNLAEQLRIYIDETIEIPETLPKISKELRKELIDLAELATRARSDVERNYRSPLREIEDVLPPEMPTRFSGQLINFARAIMVINWNETGVFDLVDEDKKILYKLALDSVTKSRRQAMQELAKYTILETAGLATKIGFPTTTVRIWLEDLTALEIAQREKGSGNKGDRWKIRPKYKNLLAKFEGLTIEDTELTESNLENAEIKPETDPDKFNDLVSGLTPEELKQAGLI